MLIASNWKDYELLDAGSGEKLERWGGYTLLRPDPQALWPMSVEARPDAHYHRSESGGGSWKIFSRLPESWRISYRNLKFIIRLTGFKHTGLFPEQAVNWEFAAKKLKTRPGARVLNLFAYTGGATAACAAAGAHVTHVDAAKGMVAWAKENLAASGLDNAPVRYIVDDVFKFVLREQRRGRTYDAIIMDPPSYGRGPGGETWKLEAGIYSLVAECAELLNENPLFFIVNSYTTGLAPGVLSNILKLTVAQKRGGTVFSDEIGLPASSRNIVLPCGATGRWES